MKFTDKQKQVMDLTCEGKSATEIASEIGKGRTTVKHHQNAIKKAFGTRDLVVAAVKYTENKVRTEVGREQRMREVYLKGKGIDFAPDNDLSPE